MTSAVLVLALTVVVALVVISVFSSQEKDDWTDNRRGTDNRPGKDPDRDATHLGDLLDP